MRLWSLHPSLLDSKGLIACWRESLLAQKVLYNETKGYKNHSQLIRFKKQESPIKAIANYLFQLWEEGLKRCYNFDETKIRYIQKHIPKIPVTKGQVQFEFSHLQNKLLERDPNKYAYNNEIFCILNKDYSMLINPIFELVDGDIEEWEKV